MKKLALLAHRRHDISDRSWERIESLLPGRKGKWGGVAKDNRLFINAVFWILRTGSPWRDLPPDYGCWKNTHRRFCRWKNKGVWASILENLTCEADMEWLMIDATHIKVHLHGTGAVGGNDEMGLTKGGLNSKLHLAVDAHGMPLRATLTSGTVADCTVAPDLLKRNTDPAFNELYSCRRADTLAKARRMNTSPRNAFNQQTTETQAFIRKELALHTSPAVISGRLRLKHGVSVSKNTLYRYIKRDRLAGGNLYLQLPHRGKYYRYGKGEPKRSAIPDRVGIEERPAEADLKQQPGHFEIDTVFGKDQKSFLHEFRTGI